jgi:uncharacterized repeat protein (TIGR01451 family)
VTAGVSTAQPPSIGNCTIFPADNIWNTRVDQLPISANSATYIQTIGTALSMHADFGSGTWDGGPIGIPYITVAGTQTKYPATFLYSDESDPGPYAVPLDAPIEGGSASTGDRHVLAIDVDNCVLYELGRAFPQTLSWRADAGAVFNLLSNALRPDTWTSTDAAGLPILPGLVRYDEIAAGEIRHAIRFTAPQTLRAYLWPARHYASSITDPKYPPMGLRVRLRGNYDISSFSAVNQVILQALKRYGMMLADNGSAWYISGAPDARWDNTDLHWLGTITGSAFEVVDVSPLMLNPDSGQARQTSLSVTKTHSGNFTQGQINAAYTVTVSNGAAAVPTSGPVTVAEVLPSGLTLGSMFGTGWTCPAGTNTCTRIDALAAGASYPAITVLVNVAANATSPQVNSVLVSGGGSPAANTIDSATIIRIPVLGIAKSHSGNFTQGQKGAAYTVSVSNAAGAGPTSGSVTVTEAVPSGMTLVSMAGTGWTCPIDANTCTRSDVLVGGTSYPAIAITVNVAANATSPQTNQVSVTGGGSATANASDSTTIAPSAQGLRFVPITPCRIADTRGAAGAFGGPAITGGTSRDFIIPNSACGVPSTAQAYSLNVAVVPATSLGYLTLWPTGQTRPLASTLNSLDGRIKSNAAIVPAGTDGAISAFASDTTDVILDINGYFVPPSDPTGLAFYPITPCRISDTRTTAAPLGGPSLGGGTTRTFPILSTTCILPATAQAYSLNFAVVPGGHPLGYLTAWPSGQTKPTVVSLNAPTGTVVANAAIVKAGTSGSIDIFASDATDLVIDINGYFAPMTTGGLSLYNVAPCRVVDTRKPPGSPAITSLDVPVGASACGIPGSAQAHVLSVTVVPPASLGYLTLWPQGQALPAVSTLNALDGAITSNLAIVPATSGSISAFASDLTHLILDISGYFGQ